MTTHMFTVCLNTCEHARCHQMPEHVWKWTLVLLPQVESCCWHIHEQAHGHHTKKWVSSPETWSCVNTGVVPKCLKTCSNVFLHNIPEHAWARVNTCVVTQYLKDMWKHVSSENTWTQVKTRVVTQYLKSTWKCILSPDTWTCLNICGVKQYLKNTWNSVSSPNTWKCMLSANTWKTPGDAICY